MNRGGNWRNYKQLGAYFGASQAENNWLDQETLEELIADGPNLIPKLEQIIDEALKMSKTMKASPQPSETNWIATVQALYLLAHLNAQDSFHLILEFLAQKQERLTHWLPDIVSDDIWEVLYLLGRDHIDELHRFVLDPNANEFSKLSACTALVQIALNNPAKTDSVVRVFSDLLQTQDQDPDFVGLVAAELMDLKEKRLHGVILEALRHNDVWSGIISEDEVNASYRKNRVRKMLPESIFERIEQFRQITHYKSTSPRTLLKRDRHYNLEKLL